jgi:hypothetical protein
MARYSQKQPYETKFKQHQECRQDLPRADRYFSRRVLLNSCVGSGINKMP